ncbi:MAG: hypothetical protein AAF502_07025 [Bacteroidota bacterium]
MKRIKQFLKNFLLISLPTLVLLFLVFEFFIFRWALPATQFPKLEYDQEFMILKPSLEGPKKGNHSMGKWAKHASTWTINNYGWVSNIDYYNIKTRPRIGIIGDSYVAAFEVNTGEAFSPATAKSAYRHHGCLQFGYARVTTLQLPEDGKICQ